MSYKVRNGGAEGREGRYEEKGRRVAATYSFPQVGESGKIINELKPPFLWDLKQTKNHKWTTTETKSETPDDDSSETPRGMIDN